MELDKPIFNAHTEAMLSHINIGTSEEVSISQLAELNCLCIGYTGNLEFDTSMPDGAPKNTLDISHLRFTLVNWTPTPLENALRLTIEDFCQKEGQRSLCTRSPRHH
jgi:GDP-L-fucose synthase